MKRCYAVNLKLYAHALNLSTDLYTAFTYNVITPPFQIRRRAEALVQQVRTRAPPARRGKEGSVHREDRRGGGAPSCEERGQQEGEEHGGGEDGSEKDEEGEEGEGGEGG